MRIHELKCQEKYFRALCRGEKPFEVRKNDRGFQVGDHLALNEIDESGNYTGCSAVELVTYILDDAEYCKEGYVVLGVERCEIIERTELERLVNIAKCNVSPGLEFCSRGAQEDEKNNTRQN